MKYLEDAKEVGWVLMSRKLIISKGLERELFVEPMPLGFKKVSDYNDGEFRFVLYDKGKLNAIETYKMGVEAPEKVYI